MHCIEIPERNIKKYLPENLSECDANQYIYICELILLYQSQQISYTEMLTSAVYFLMDMKVAKPNQNTTEEADEDDNQTKESNIVLISELLADTFFELVDEQIKINLDFTDNPVKKFKPLWRNYYGPSDGFMNGKCGEYIDALQVFEEFNASKDFNLLYELAAILYRPRIMFYSLLKHLPNYNGDCRIRYNSNHLQKRIATFKYAPIGFIYGVYLWFASFQKFLSTAEIPKGDKILKLQILFDGSGKSIDVGADDIGMESVLFAMADSGTFGSYKDVQNTDFWTMMIRMYDSRLRELKQEKHEKDHANSK